MGAKRRTQIIRVGWCVKNKTTSIRISSINCNTPQANDLAITDIIMVNNEVCQTLHHGREASLPVFKVANMQYDYLEPRETKSLITVTLPQATAPTALESEF